MSDYGFATYDDKNEKKLGSINSKWPIFGPKYSQIAKCFKTIHITDTYEPSFKTANLGSPSLNSNGWGETEYRWHERTLICQFKHGFNYRPMGYAVFSGNLVLNVPCQIVQSVNNWQTDNNLGGNFTLNGRKTETVPILPSLKEQMVMSYVDTSYTGNKLIPKNYLFEINTSSYPTRDITVPDDCVGYIKRQFYVSTEGLGAMNPYEVEIDDEYVKIYRNLYWLDWRGRYYYAYNSSYSSTYSFRYEANERVKGMTSWAGSSVDCTVYLAPYRIGDLL